MDRGGSVFHWIGNDGVIFRVLERNNDKILRGVNNGIIELELGTRSLNLWGEVINRSDSLLILIPLSAARSSPHSSETWSSRTAATRFRSPSSTACSSVSRRSPSCRKCRRRLLSCFCSFLLFPSSSASSRNAKGSDLFLCADLDDTLYPLSSGIASHVKKNIEGKLSPAVTDRCSSLFSEFSVN